jgi:hypothetical protein
MSTPLDHVLELSDEEWVRLERIAGQFERAWREGARPSIEDALPADPKSRSSVLIELVHVELEFRLRAGEPARVEEYLDRIPELKDDAAVVWGLVRSELELRRSRGPGSSLDEFLARFPQCAEPLRHLWEDLARDGPGGASLGFPLDGEGRSRIGKFELKEIVGRGAFGVVYHARDTETGRDVALKVLRPEHSARREVVDRLLREARSTSRLDHPNIVRVHEAGWSGSTCFLTSELIRGSTLADRLAGGGLSFNQGAELVAGVASPKSVMCGRPSASIRRFDGFRSRWITPRLWAKWSASATDATSSAAWRKERPCLIRRSESVDPWISSLTR